MLQEMLFLQQYFFLAYFINIDWKNTLKMWYKFCIDNKIVSYKILHKIYPVEHV